MRREFEKRFDKPLEGGAERFVWDYWHVENQYTLIRTPAYRYFQEALYKKFHARLVEWGRRNLGCHDVSPPWMSYYIDGCRQEWHADVPHGPWAFVFSLTPWKTRKFRGGETLILKPETLSYWQGLDSLRGVEKEHLLDAVPSEFNRLLVFDPRFPHAVAPVEGVRDPRDARLVIHGWFLQPRPFFEGPRSQTPFFREVEKWSGLAIPSLELPECNGVLVSRLRINASGHIQALEIVRQNLRTRTGETFRNRDLEKYLAEISKEFRFSRASGVTTLTLPWQFD